MKLYPTERAIHFGLSGCVLTGVGLLTKTPLVVAWGVAVVLAIAIARGAALSSVARIRQAGFEMLWSSRERRQSAARGEEITLRAEIRNRDTLAVRFVALRALASPQLDLKIEPQQGQVPAGGRVFVDIVVSSNRVGGHGIYGLALEVRGSPGLFEVPLTFPNPFGVDVTPAPARKMLRLAVGGRSGRVGPARGRGVRRGSGDDFRELRHYQPGDAFRAIAWRASAKRGALVVRETDQDERERVWCILDASCELWTGETGAAPLDLAIDGAAAQLLAHLSRGDAAGLLVVGGRQLAVVEPNARAGQRQALLEALKTASSTYDYERCDYDEAAVAIRVFEHLRPLDSRGLRDINQRDFDALSKRARKAMARAPFEVPLPQAPSPRERVLRHYLASFGVPVAPLSASERLAADSALVKALEQVADDRLRPSQLYVFGHVPKSGSAPLEKALARLRRRRVVVHWHQPEWGPALRALDTGKLKVSAVVEATAMSQDLRTRRNASYLRKFGVRPWSMASNAGL